MSKRSTKQRRAALWRREWQRAYREAVSMDPGTTSYGAPLFSATEWDALVPDIAHYSERLQRHEPTRGGMGLRWPQQAERYWVRLDAKDKLRSPADRERNPR